MKKYIFAAAALFAAAGVQAAGFELNAGSPALLLKAAPPLAAAPAATAPVRAKAARLVQVSGYLQLNANPWLPQGGGFTSFNAAGWASFRDSSGKVYSNNVHISQFASAWLRPGQYVTQPVNVSQSVQFYRDGRPVGSAWLSGYVNLSGWAGQQGMVMLSGSGYLNGSLYVEDAE